MKTVCWTARNSVRRSGSFERRTIPIVYVRVKTTFPMTFRDAIICSASAARSSGNVAETCGFSLPSTNHSSECFTRVGEALRLAAREVAPEDADDRASFQQREVERNLRDLAGREADDEQAAAPGDRSQRRLGVRPADRVVDDVDAAGRRSIALIRSRRSSVA